ncbi:MAG: tetratricopeptide repeat protein [bacterium]
MKKFLLFLVILVLLNCAPTYVESIVTSKGAVLEIDGARFKIPENSIRDSTQIRIEKKGVAKKNYEQEYRIKGESFVISPETLFFEKPLRFSLPVRDPNAALGAKIGNGFVPLANSIVEGETLSAQLWHGGEYYVIKKPMEYGIKDHSDTDEGMIIVCDLYVSDYITNFKKVLRQGGYDFPIWTFVYPNDKSIKENALFLADELKKLHEDYGEFRLDIVSFGIGGLIANRYIADTSIYQRDVSSAVIAVGTPFHGSNFADYDSVKKGRSPYRFFFIDGLGDNIADLQPESGFISWIRKSRLGKHYYDCPEEAMNFASIRGRLPFKGEFPEEYEGDGLVSVEATYLTPLEPEPFPLSHFELFENNEVHTVIGEFVQLYRIFNWPLVFSRVWKEEEEFSKILELWEKEKKLHYRGVGFEQLLEWDENMLESAPKDAILITNGDNDTYPAWYVQEKKGIRNDVLIVNRNLLNLKEHVIFLQKKGLSLDITEAELDKIKHKREDGKVITKSDQLIKMLVEQGKRPVAFSTTVYKPERYDYPLRLSGVVYEIGEGDVAIGDKYVDIVRTQELLHQVFSYDKLTSVPYDSLSQDIQAMYSNHAASAFTLSLALKNQGKYEEALKEIQFAYLFVADNYKHIFYYNEALIHWESGENDKADSIFTTMLSMPYTDLETKKMIARAYYDMEMTRETIRILAECLKDNPDDKEILELIKEYQEGL